MGDREYTLNGASNASDLDVVIVGGGPAGLSAALWLARYRRRVRVLDTHSPRNAATDAVHGYPGLPHASPAELRRRLREQALEAGADVQTATVTEIDGHSDAFMIRSEAGGEVSCRRVLLAYGRRDQVPDIPGLARAYGTSVHHCADCDGPTIADEATGVIGWGRQAAGLALFLRTWSDHVRLFLDGHTLRLSSESTGVLRRHDIEVHAEAIEQIVQHDGQVEAVRLTGGARVPVRHLFVHLGTPPASQIADAIGCAIDERGDVITDTGQKTTVPGVYAAGDIAGHPYLAAIAAAEGVTAALSIHRSLLPTEFELGAAP